MHPVRGAALLERDEPLPGLVAAVAGLHADPVVEAQVVIQVGLDHTASPGCRPATLRQNIFGGVHQLVVRHHLGDQTGPQRWHWQLGWRCGRLRGCFAERVLAL